MAKEIYLSTVKAQLDNIVDESGNTANIMKNINTEYVDGTQAEWNTVKAAQFMENFCATFNDYISQFNAKYQEGINSFIEGVNELARHEDAEPVGPRTITRLPELAKGWQGQAEDFNIPDDYAGFTATHLTANITKLKNSVETIQQYIDVAVSNGLSESFCTTLRSKLEELKNSADSVSEQYNRAFVEQSVNEDTAISTIKSNT